MLHLWQPIATPHKHISGNPESSCFAIMPAYDPSFVQVTSDAKGLLVSRMRGEGRLTAYVRSHVRERGKL